MIRLIAGDFTVDATAQDGQPRRTISGTAVPYNTAATVNDGTTVIFRPGSLPVEGKAPRLFMYHDATQPVGVVTERVDTEQGMLFSARISQTRLGQDALVMAQDGTIDQVSVGVNPIQFSYDEAGTMIIEKADWQELSLVPLGAFGDQAGITSVAASIPETGTPTDHNGTQETKESEPTMTIETPKPEAVEAVEATIPTIPATPKREFAMPTPGEYMAAYHIGGDTFRRVKDAYKLAASKKQTAIQAALAQDLTTDTGGLLGTPVLGPVFQNYAFIRPVVSAIGTRAMPNGNGKSFIRPIITQHTAAGVQTEGSAVTSQKMTLSSNSVTRQTVAGGVFISQQDIDFTDPAALNTILTDLTGQYMKETDNIAADACVTASQTSGYTWTVTAGDPTSLMDALYGCAFNISNSTNLFATHLLVSVDVWQKLGGQLDDAKRPLFPAIGAPGLIGQNTLGAGSAASWSGMNPLGLEIVVDGNFAASTMLVVHAPAIEFYEQVRGIMSVEDPELLGRNFSYYGYFATFFQDAADATAGSRFVQKITVA
jgi:HK97 family phage prohead protease